MRNEGKALLSTEQEVWITAGSYKEEQADMKNTTGRAHKCKMYSLKLKGNAK